MPKTREYALEDWPATDQAAWHAATSTEVRYFGRGKYARWSPATKRQAFYAYCRWLAFLTESDPAALLSAPVDRLARERLGAFIDAVARGVSGKGVTAQTVVSTLIHLINAIHAVAPGYQTQSLRQMQHRFQRHIKPRDKRARMEQANELYALGIDLMNEAVKRISAREGARAFRDGLIIAVLVSSTLRRKNLAALRIDKDLQRVGLHYHIAIDARATKSRRKRIDHPLPPELTPYLDEYITNYRLRFAGARTSDALWLSSKHGAMCPEAIREAVRRRTRAAFGHAINLHLFRDIAASSAPHLGTSLLGHNKATLTDQYYRRSDPLAASRKLGALIASLRCNAPTATLGAWGGDWTGGGIRPPARNQVEEKTIA